MNFRFFPRPRPQCSAGVVPWAFPSLTAAGLRAILFAVLNVTLMIRCGYGQEASHPTLLISEIMPSNVSTLKDEDGDSPDWIELRNYGDAPVELEGLVLIVGRKKPSRWVLPQGRMEPGAYRLIFASGKDRGTGEKPLHAGFKLGAKGEYLALLNRDGKTVIHDYDPKFPGLDHDVSFGISGEWRPGLLPAEFARILDRPTPGTANPGGLLGEVAEVKLSHRRGFYEEPFDLVLTTRTEGATIRYTTNGSVPTPDRGLTYTGPIRIGGTTILRVAAFKTGYRPSKVKTHTVLFVQDVVKQSPDGLPPEGFPYLWDKNQVDYGMDPRVTEDPKYRAELVAGLKSIPTVSLVADLDDLFGPTRGIYSHAGEQGREAERPASIEYLEPNGGPGFQIHCGVRIRGGFSRMPVNPKHAFRLFFREEYGDGPLKYPLFGRDGAQTFEALDLRTSQNYSWSLCADPRATFLRDQFNRDLQRAMGQPAARGDFCHLYINGQYWGLYDTCERPEASFGATYLGGRKSDFDAVKVDSGFTTRESTYTVMPTDGNLEAWTRLYQGASNRLGNVTNYFALQGRNPDGSVHPNQEALLDVDNLIDYMLIIFWGGNLDAPISAFGDNRNPNNFHALRRRNGDRGFQFFIWDAEHTMLNLGEDRTGPFKTGDRLETSSPQWLWQQCVENPEFRLRVADRVQRHFSEGGALNAKSLRDRFQNRARQIEAAVVAESARWGDVKQTLPMGAPPRLGTDGKLRTGPLNRDEDWRPEIARLLNEYIPRRGEIVLAQLYSQGLLPDVAAPEFIPESGSGSEPLRLRISAQAGDIFFTTDGTDPRRVGGTPSPTARKYTGPVAVPAGGKIAARALREGDWSALAQSGESGSSISAPPERK